MKNVLIALAFALVAASCNQGQPTADIAVIRQQVADSMNTEAKKRGVDLSITSARFAEPAGGRIPPMVPPLPPPSYYIPHSIADHQIQAYHKLFVGADKQHRNATLDVVNMKRTAFVIPASTLNILLDSPNYCENVIFYLAYDEVQKEITLVYTGTKYVQPATGGPLTDSIKEILVKRPDAPNEQFVFNNAWPCPTCDGIGVHSQYRPLSTMIYASVSQGGTLTPNGDVPVKYGDNQVFQYSAAPGYVLDTVMIDGTLRTDHPSSFPFNAVKESHSIWVKYKRNN